MALLNNKKMKKMKITNQQLYKQLTKLVMVDVAVLLLWTLTTPSRGVTRMRNEAGVGEVEETVCVTEQSSIVTLMLLYKV